MSALEDRIRDAYCAAGPGPPSPRHCTAPPSGEGSPLVVPASGLVAGLVAAGIVYTLPEASSPREAVPVAMLQPAVGEIAIFLRAKTSANASCGQRDATSAERAHRTQPQEASWSAHDPIRAAGQAFAEFKQRFRDMDIAKDVRIGDIPASFRVKYRSSTDVPKIETALMGRPGVDQIISRK